MNSSTDIATLSKAIPKIGQLVQVRSRRWLVEDVTKPKKSGDVTFVQLACADDDAQGQSLDVYWEYELDRKILEEENWNEIAKHGFDEPRQFAAFLHTLQWNCVTSTDPTLFQSPFRAGIKIDAYQMEPLRKALLLPRVNLFIADDTGLGKTIEAGLIARELLLRKKVKTIVVSSPPSVMEQWKGELEDRFGLVFEILDRAYLTKVRRERGFGINPWRTHSRFLISHNLLIDPTYTDPLREWLGNLLPGSMLILDEAHHAAPSSGGKYGIETKFTRAIRDISNRFEHKLFLSATPHNGHSNSFSTLLEILDPYRFTRGVPINGKDELTEVMVRRLKEDIREVQGGFPVREVKRIVLDNLPADAPEIMLSVLLDKYRTTRETRFSSSSSKARATAGLLVIGLQQRMLSSTEAFARSLIVHRATVERHWQKAVDKSEPKPTSSSQAKLFATAAGPDDEESEWTAEEIESLEASQIEVITASAEEDVTKDAHSEQLWQQEQQLLDQMQAIAEEGRHLLDAKTNYLIDWIRDNLCPGLPLFDSQGKGDLPKWNNRRVLIFTENREGTKRYLKMMIERAISGTDDPDNRIAVIDGMTRGPRRKEIQQRFNTDPSKDPLRILLATDAAREGLNFQAHCTDLFHFDLPWNPGRIEQRNGRIDRKLQPAKVVRCHYFILPQRVEDRVLEVLVRKTETIKKELGSLSKVIDADIERSLGSGIKHSDVETLVKTIDSADLDQERKRRTAEEFDDARDRQEDLKAQIKECQNLLEKSREWVRFKAESFRDALSCSLELLGADPLIESQDDNGKPVWTFPQLDRRAQADSSWASTLDTLRSPKQNNQKVPEWRREAPIRPIVFEDSGILSDDTVHIHLEQRVAQRLLARFRSQGYIYHDLSRACLAQTKDSIPRVVLLGKLSLFGQSAERLHEEIIAITARWIDPATRSTPLEVFNQDAESKTLDLLEDALNTSLEKPLTQTIQTKLLSSAQVDVGNLLPYLEPRAKEIAKGAKKQLHERGRRERDNLKAILTKQKKKIEKNIKKHDGEFVQLTLHFNIEEKRQLESNIKSWRNRLSQFEHDLQVEPHRIEEFYEVKAERIEPIGLVYLWPETN